MKLDNRNILNNKLIYVQLLLSLTPEKYGGILNHQMKDLISNIFDFIKNSYNDEFCKKQNEFHKLLDTIIDRYKDKFEKIMDIDTIAYEFNNLFKNNSNIYSSGIEYGWLIKVFNYLKLPYHNYLPYQSKIGVGAHVGNISIEEEFLLRDAFYLLVKANDTFIKMHEYNDFLELNKTVQKNEHVFVAVANMNRTVAAFSRLSILSFYSFFEAFINSIGYDFYYRNKNHLTCIEGKNLRGKKADNYHYLKTEEKIEKFQEIIRNDKTVVLKIDNKKQTSPNYKLFFNEIKLIRNSSVHFSPNMKSIWRKPDEWIDNAKVTSTVTLKICSEIWNAVYPTKELPKYLNELKYDENYHIAEQRLKDVSKVENKEIIL